MVTAIFDALSFTDVRGLRSAYLDLPMGHLSTTQLGELNRAYNDEGVQELQTERKITYHDAVSYEVIGQADEFDGRGAEDDSVVKVGTSWRGD